MPLRSPSAVVLPLAFSACTPSVCRQMRRSYSRQTSRLVGQEVGQRLCELGDGQFKLLASGLTNCLQTSCCPKWLQPLTRYVVPLQANILENVAGLT
jgi:hypothetical protein